MGNTRSAPAKMRESGVLSLAVAVISVACAGTDVCFNIYGLPCPKNDAERSILMALPGTLEDSTPGVARLSVGVAFRDGSTRETGLHACGPSSPPTAYGCGLRESIRATP